MMAAAGAATLAEAPSADRGAVSQANEGRVEAVSAAVLDVCMARSESEIECLARVGPYADAYVLAMRAIARCISSGGGDRAQCEAESKGDVEAERAALGECGAVVRALITEAKRAPGGS